MSCLSKLDGWLGSKGEKRAVSPQWPCGLAPLDHSHPLPNPTNSDGWHALARVGMFGAVQEWDHGQTSLAMPPFFANLFAPETKET